MNPWPAVLIAVVLSVVLIEAAPRFGGMVLALVVFAMLMLNANKWT